MIQKPNEIDETQYIYNGGAKHDYWPACDFFIFCNYSKILYSKSIYQIKKKPFLHDELIYLSLLAIYSSTHWLYGHGRAFSYWLCVALWTTKCYTDVPLSCPQGTIMGSYTELVGHINISGVSKVSHIAFDPRDFA